jgi:hypothetical protein
MSISRDEAREIAIVGLLATVALRIGAGVFQMIQELTGDLWTVQSLLGRLFAPIGSTVGMLILGAVLLIVLSPAGSITRSVVGVTRKAAATVAALGVASSFHTLALSLSPLLAKIWISMINGLAASALGLTAWWILRNFDADR